MKKTLSGFFVFLLFVSLAVLAGAVAMYAYQELSGYEKDNSSVQIPFIPSKQESSREYSRIEGASVNTSQKDVSFSAHAYDALVNEKLRFLYEKLDESVYRISDEMTDDGRYKTKTVEVEGAEFSSDDINIAINAYLCDHPEVFWIDNYFGYHSSKNKTYVECYSVLSGNQCELYIKSFNEALSEMLSGITSADGEYEREKLLHDKLLDKCSYKKGVDSIDDGWQYFSAYGAVVEGQAVCEGYSKAMMLLLRLAGVDSVTVRGMGEGEENVPERHMWNLVNIGDKWYQLDSTWDDSDGTDHGYDFFNLTAESMGTDHTPDPVLDESAVSEDSSYNFFIPDCTSVDMNYYYREGVVVSGLDDKADDDIADKVYDLYTKGEHLLYILIEDDVRYDDFMNVMLKNGGHRFYDCLERVNNYVGKEVFDTSHCHLTENERRRTVRIRLSDPDS